jgi:hypothetical protein
VYKNFLQTLIINTTWTKDANLFQTQAAGNANLVADIIAANKGVIFDTPNIYDTVANSGIHTLTSADFTTGSGTMDWWGTKAWIGYLNLTSYHGYSNWAWALPTTVPATAGYSQTGSQMGELFYNELGGVAGAPITATHNANYYLFTNVQSSAYWSGSEYASNPNYAWFFGTSNGFQTNFFKTTQFYAWAVRPGDVSAVPVPAAFWLFGSGLMGLRRRGNIG